MTADSNRNRQVGWVVLGLLLLVLVGVIDYLTGPQYTLALFYLAPVLLITWVAGRWAGLGASVASMLVWFLADAAMARHAGSPLWLVFLWDGVARLSMLAIATWLLAALKQSLQREKDLARTDYLTGALNTRAFYEMVEMAINSLARFGHPFTLVYLDLDGFKEINDSFGHATGDLVLNAAANAIRKQMRKTDSVARLGGDEFGILLVETTQDAARPVIARIQQNFAAVAQRRTWPVTFSAGVLTCTDASRTIADIIGKADEIMYAVKQGSKDGIAYAEMRQPSIDSPTASK